LVIFVLFCVESRTSETLLIILSL